MRLHLKPALRGLCLADLTTQHLTLLPKEAPGGPISPFGALHAHDDVQSPPRGRGRRLVRKNVALWAKPPKDEYEEKTVLSVADAMLFL